MSKAATVYDVADRAGVSIATVSRVLRSPDAVRPVTRERVLDAVAALGYVPSGSARGLAERRAGVLGLYFPGFDAAEDAPPLDALSAADSEAPPFAIVREEAEVDGRHTSMLFLDEVLRGAELEAWKQGFVLMVGVGRDDPIAPPCGTWQAGLTGSWSSPAACPTTCWPVWRDASPWWCSPAPRAAITTTM